MRRRARSVTWYRSVNKLIFRHKWFFIFSFFFYFLFFFPCKAAIRKGNVSSFQRETRDKRIPYWRKRGKLPRRPRAPAPRLFTERMREGKRGFEIACVHRRCLPRFRPPRNRFPIEATKEAPLSSIACFSLTTLFSLKWNARLVIIYVAKKEVTNEGKIRNRG